MRLSPAKLERNKETARIFLGDISEPASFASLGAGLNYYSAHSDTKKSKMWAIEWVEKYDQELAKQLHSVRDSFFNNRGFVCRMLEKGIPIEPKDIDALLPFFKKLVDERNHQRLPDDAAQHTPVKTNAVAVPPRCVPSNLAIIALDEQIDNAIEGHLISKVDLGADKKELAEVESYINRTLEDFVVSKEGYSNRVIAVLRPLLKSVLEELKTKLNTLTKGNTRANIIDKSPVQMIKKVRYKLEDETLGLKSVLLKGIIGKRQCWAYDTEDRYLMLYVAKDANGFWFSGTTIQNLDLEKSMRRVVRKPEEFFQVISKPLTMEGINTSYSSIRAKDLPIKTGMTNNSIIFLKV